MTTDPNVSHHAPSASAARVATLAALALAVAAGGCFPEFDTTEKTSCASDADCNAGNLCVMDEGVDGLGRCVAESAIDGQTNNDDGCRGEDLDMDGAFAGEGCDPLDCDDEDRQRSPLLEETCDGRDNDCDTIVDEGVLSACGSCDPLPEETCNGRDDDCDGVIDDDVLNACGFCGPAPEEFCDTDDNDCDGAVDEGLDCGCDPADDQRACPQGDIEAAVCEQGAQSCTCEQGDTCDVGRWGPCEGLVVSCIEVCDGEDNDDDGTTDNGFNLADDLDNCGQCGSRCGTFQSRSDCDRGECALDCVDGWIDADGDVATGCEYPCLGSSSQDICEDGLDNDCNGVVDDTCTKKALGGRYTFYNLFGWSSEGLPPGLLVGTLDIEEPIGGAATVSDATLHLSELPDGARTFSTPSARQLVLGEGNVVELRPVGEEDFVGAIFKGHHTDDPGRSIMVFNELSQEGNTRASLAIAVRELPQEVPIGTGALKGPYTAIQMLPGRLIGDGAGNSTAIFAVNLDADAERGRGVIRSINSTAGRQEFAPEQAPRIEYQVSRGAEASLAITGPSLGLTWHGRMSHRGDFGAATVQLDGQLNPEPGLLTFVQRGRPIDLASLHGSWAVSGLQIARDDADEELDYRAVNTTVEVAAGEGGAVTLTTDGDGEPLPFGTGHIVREATGDVVELRTTSPSINGGDLILRGLPTADGRAMLLWEHIEETNAPATSVYVAVRLPSQEP